MRAVGGEVASPRSGVIWVFLSPSIIQFRWLVRRVGRRSPSNITRNSIVQLFLERFVVLVLENGRLVTLLPTSRSRINLAVLIASSARDVIPLVNVLALFP